MPNICNGAHKVLMAGLGLVDLICQTADDTITVLSQRGEKAAQRIKNSCKTCRQPHEKHTDSSCAKGNIDEAIETFHAATEN